MLWVVVLLLRGLHKIVIITICVCEWSIAAGILLLAALTKMEISHRFSLLDLPFRDPTMIF